MSLFQGPFCISDDDVPVSWVRPSVGGMNQIQNGANGTHTHVRLSKRRIVVLTTRTGSYGKKPLTDVMVHVDNFYH